MKYQVHGKEFRSGRRLRLTLIAPDEVRARAAAEKRGLIVESINIVTDAAAAHTPHEEPVHLPPVPETPLPQTPPAGPANEDLAALSAMALPEPAVPSESSTPAAPSFAAELPAETPDYLTAAHARPPAYAALRTVSTCLIITGWVILALGSLGAVLVVIAYFADGTSFGAGGFASGGPPLYACLISALYVILVCTSTCFLFLGFGLGLRTLADIGRNSYIAAHR